MLKRRFLIDAALHIGSVTSGFLSHKCHTLGLLGQTLRKFFHFQTRVAANASYIIRSSNGLGSITK